MDLAIAQMLEKAEFNGRHVWNYLIPSTIGNLYVVQHECVGLEVVDDYIGRSEQRAEQKFVQVTKKLLDGKI